MLECVSDGVSPNAVEKGIHDALDYISQNAYLQQVKFTKLLWPFLQTLSINAVASKPIYQVQYGQLMYEMMNKTAVCILIKHFCSWRKGWIKTRVWAVRTVVVAMLGHLLPHENVYVRKLQIQLAVRVFGSKEALYGVSLWQTRPWPSIARFYHPSVWFAKRQHVHTRGHHESCASFPQ